MERNRTFVGLDVHAWSVTGHALDGVTGEVWQRKLTPDFAETQLGPWSVPKPVLIWANMMRSGTSGDWPTRCSDAWS